MRNGGVFSVRMWTVDHRVHRGFTGTQIGFFWCLGRAAVPDPRTARADPKMVDEAWRSW